MGSGRTSRDDSSRMGVSEGMGTLRQVGIREGLLGAKSGRGGIVWGRAAGGTSSHAPTTYISLSRSRNLEKRHTNTHIQYITSTVSGGRQNMRKGRANLNLEA